jgi:hypothetical protein
VKAAPLTWQLFCSGISQAMTTVLLLVATLIGLLYGAWRLSRNRRNPDFWEGGLLWLMSFLVVVILLVRS